MLPLSPVLFYEHLTASQALNYHCPQCPSLAAEVFMDKPVVKQIGNEMANQYSARCFHVDNVTVIAVEWMCCLFRY